jgi:hypothetical protein
MSQTDPLAKLTLSTQRYQETEAAHDAAREDVIADVIAALQAGADPTDVVESSPFTAADVQKLARQHGIDARPRGAS